MSDVLKFHGMSDLSRRSFYDQKWSDSVQHKRVPVDKERASIIVELVKQSLGHNPSGAKRRVLDVGCGVGWLTHALLAFGDVTGVDSSQSAVALAQQACPEGKFRRIDMLSIEQTNSLGVFDIVVCSEVFEHIPNSEKPIFIEALARLVSPGGFLVLTTPNGLCWKHYWQEPGSEEGRQPVEDWCTPVSLRAKFARKFECQAFRTFGFGFSHRGIFRVLNSVKLNTLFGWLGIGRWWHSVRERKYGLYMAGKFKRV